MRLLAIVGTARGDSHTTALLDAVLGGRAATRIDLRTLHIDQYEYDLPIDRDAFGDIAAAMVSHDVIVVATPVYWYSMSGRMKVFFDRLTDLVTVRKDLGRQLKGRRLIVLACGSDPELPKGFEIPFVATAAYLHMKYGGVFYAQTTASGGLVPSALAAASQFGDQVFAQ